MLMSVCPYFDVRGDQKMHRARPQLHCPPKHPITGSLLSPLWNKAAFVRSDTRAWNFSSILKIFTQPSAWASLLISFSIFQTLLWGSQSFTIHLSLLAILFLGLYQSCHNAKACCSDDPRHLHRAERPGDLLHRAFWSRSIPSHCKLSFSITSYF
jgi:hypothetical protein